MRLASTTGHLETLKTFRKKKQNEIFSSVAKGDHLGFFNIHSVAKYG